MFVLATAFFSIGKIEIFFELLVLRTLEPFEQRTPEPWFKLFLGIKTIFCEQESIHRLVY